MFISHLNSSVTYISAILSNTSLIYLLIVLYHYIKKVIKIKASINPGIKIVSLIFVYKYFIDATVNCQLYCNIQLTLQQQGC